MIMLIALAVLTATCCALTVALLGALRGIAELRLRLVRAGGVGGNGFRLDSGRALPDLLSAALPAEPTMVGFVSDDCPACRRLLDELARLALPDGRLVLAVTGKDTGELRRHAIAPVLPAEAAGAAAHELGLDFTPIVIIAAGYHSFGGWKDSAFGDHRMYGDEAVHFYTRGEVITSHWPETG